MSTQIENKQESNAFGITSIHHTDFVGVVNAPNAFGPNREQITDMKTNPMITTDTQNEIHFPSPRPNPRDGPSPYNLAILVCIGSGVFVILITTFILYNQHKI
jgi:hypothetical protein